ncbi:ribonuclease HII [Nitrosophilus alvini]|uniref:ribonuclease HII n=1 Tax=Nitrosophilus alvini TaxID=2714855 RepID=UPI00190BB60C|nr:ribonuclease HII [Nitrosophilus alvini]
MRNHLCGIDEAGRGPLAGPLVVAGVVLEKEIEGLADSKALSQTRREKLYETILENSLYKIVFVDNKTIDDIGLSKSISYALRQIISAIDAEKYLFDGNSKFGVSEIEVMIKADTKIEEVKAASILAKVSRDRYMAEISSKYPGYGFEKHKGYPTKEHIEAIKKLGLCPIHRKSFRPKALQPTLF